MKFFRKFSGVRKTAKRTVQTIAPFKPKFQVADSLFNLPADSATQVLNKVDTPPDVNDVLEKEISPMQGPATFLKNLLSNPAMYLLGVKFLANGMTTPAAIGWAAESAEIGRASCRERV